MHIPFVCMVELKFPAHFQWITLPTQPCLALYSSDYYYYYYYYSLIRAFHISVSRWFFHWSLSNSKFPRVSRTLLSILAVLVWTVSTRPPTSKSPGPFSNPLVTVPNAPITIGIIVICKSHSFFNSLAWSMYLSFFFFHILSVLFCGQPGQQN